ncbi:HAD superfamily hydrolase [Spiroplasma sp. NBRC 100390]|uniref:HAD family hydrolase n=1 Tax=unclassified Spiroplasma TaxID=2637901 RepID=UPI00089291F9|nr:MULTISPECIES: HAD family hydrolase [unclassified Spiroplasma]AOX43444.1 HAD superfamily hydrolase [Spiroplasma sp. TU-14]APE12914.1 HAD superfamily hydrolase [Spiroplasma sp. NBRC 100390]
MEYKLIALDLDGTTASRNRISKQNIAAIKWALANDIKVIIATGRSIGAIRKVAKKLGIIEKQMPVVGFNGGIIYDFAKEKIIQQNAFTNEELITVFNIANEYRIQLWAYSVANDHLAYVNTNRGFMVKWMSIHTKRKRILVKNSNTLHDQAYKFVVSGKKENVLKFKAKILVKYEFNVFDSSYLMNQSLNLEISPKNSDKKDALEYVTKIYNIQPSEVIAMGDSSNDYEMLKWAGLGIAMGNAKNHIKDISDDVTAHYRRSGVAKAINKYFKK